ncbi:unnamed protein product [Urochloa decumbens]|uniref:PHD finger protein ALFIN-LIKE n=1 Tax=Urochloa decumbens TaxID=240449 RepID=A0ABC9GH19_9POAL
MDSSLPPPAAKTSSAPQQQAAHAPRGQQDTTAPMEVEVTPPTPAPPPSAIWRPRYSGTVERTFRQFTYRRVALIRAVTRGEDPFRVSRSYDRLARIHGEDLAPSSCYVLDLSLALAPGLGFAFGGAGAKRERIHGENIVGVAAVAAVVVQAVWLSCRSGADAEQQEEWKKPRMESLCLYGNIDGSWEVLPPKPFEPSGQPEPKLGINLVRDKMRHLKWLQHISRHSDAWLIRISFFRAANLEASERQRLFSMISMLPTVQEAFIASVTYRRISHQENMIDETKDEDEGCGPTFCASCGDRYHAKGFWVCCTLCKCWSHGKCVKVKADQEELVKNFECPECCAEKRGHD